LASFNCTLLLSNLLMSSKQSKKPKMSYNTYHSYQSTSNNEYSNSDFNRLSNSISTNVQKISQNVNSMQKMVNQLGTTSDTEQLRQQLHNTQHYTNQLSKDTNNLIKEINYIQQTDSSSDHKQRRMLKEKLTSEFLESLKNFQVIQRTAAQKEKESITRARTNSFHKGTIEENSNLIDLQSPEGNKQQIQLQIEEEVDLNLLREREQSVKKLETDIVEVNQIFKDIAKIVHNQGEKFDSIEANVEAAAVHVTDGAQELAKAREYHAKGRRRSLTLTCIFASIAFFLMFIVWKSS